MPRHDVAEHVRGSFTKIVAETAAATAGLVEIEDLVSRRRFAVGVLGSLI